MDIILTENLNLEKLPKKMATWDIIIIFASTFNIENELPNGTKIKSIYDVSHNSSIQDLRCALYIEWRRYNHSHSDPENKVLKQAWDVVEWIREKLKSSI
jgi:hypothetical protein